MTAGVARLLMVWLVVLGVASVAQAQMAMVYEFSLDIGSDCELSDPQFDGDEFFDPGDVYLQTQLVPGPTNGFKDDAMIFGMDPPPDPLTLGSAVPVGSGNMNMSAELFDLDGHDQLSVDLTELMIEPPIMVGQLPPLTCVYAPNVLYWSFDDDQAPGWPSGDVPVNALSPMGWIYGMTNPMDEIIAAQVTPTLPAMFVTPPTGVADERMVNAMLGPNPDAGNPEDDDVDSLDVVHEDVAMCPFWYFTCDHEAVFTAPGIGPLDPADIYLANPTGGLGPVLAIDNLVLGVPNGTDVDAFEFTIWEDAAQGMQYLAVLFSVDEDDPMTAANESGGLNPNMVYLSTLNGQTMAFLLLEDDVDALALWPELPPPPPPSFLPNDPAVEPAPDTTLAKQKNNVIWLVFDQSIAIAASAPVTIEQLIMSSPETLGPDQAGSFAFSLMTSNVANDTLKVKEGGPVLVNQTWYRVKPTGTLTDATGVVPVSPFVYDVCTLIGDATADGVVMALDLGLIWSYNGAVTDQRFDTNGDGTVMALDLGMAWSFNGVTAPPKP